MDVFVSSYSFALPSMTRGAGGQEEGRMGGGRREKMGGRRSREKKGREKTQKGRERGRKEEIRRKGGGRREKRGREKGEKRKGERDPPVPLSICGGKRELVLLFALFCNVIMYVFIWRLSVDLFFSSGDNVCLWLFLDISCIILQNHGIALYLIK